MSRQKSQGAISGNGSNNGSQLSQKLSQSLRNVLQNSAAGGNKNSAAAQKMQDLLNKQQSGVSLSVSKGMNASASASRFDAQSSNNNSAVRPRNSSTKQNDSSKRKNSSPAHSPSKAISVVPFAQAESKKA